MCFFHYGRVSMERACPHYILHVARSRSWRPWWADAALPSLLLLVGIVLLFEAARCGVKPSGGGGSLAWEAVCAFQLCTCTHELYLTIKRSAFIPRCNEEGYYKGTQCHGSTGQCWCVDKYGNELAGSRKQGPVTCEEEQETSGDFGSGGSVVLLDDMEEEHEAEKSAKEGKLKIHVRSTNDDDEDEDDDKDDDVGYIW